MIIDPTNDDFIPSIGHPVGSMRIDTDYRQPDKTLWPEGDELKYALPRRTRFDYDDKTETLRMFCYRTRPNWASLKHSLAELRTTEKKIVRAVVIYCSPDIWREYLLEFDYHKFERDEGLESRSANGIAAVRKLRVKEGAA